MVRLTLRYGLTTAVILAASLAVTHPAAAQSVGPGAPPVTIDAIHPTVSGILVAKPASGEGNLPSTCRDRDRASVGAAVMQRRGLVICTEEGKLVLLNLSRDTGLLEMPLMPIQHNSSREHPGLRPYGAMSERASRALRSSYATNLETTRTTNLPKA